MIVPFVIGILTSEARREENKLKAAACFGLAIFLSCYQPHRLFEYVSLLIVFIIILPPVFPFLRLGVLGSIAETVLCGGFGRYIGDRSYSIYLIHMLVLVPLLTMFSHMPWMLAASTPVRAIIASVAMLAICFPLSGLLYAYIEQPMIKVGRAVVRSMRASYYEAPVSHPPIQGEGVRVARANN
jgi:peptidoglycan/LPS O-acetylase OafA/YrhL